MYALCEHAHAGSPIVGRCSVIVNWRNRLGHRVCKVVGAIALEQQAGSDVQDECRGADRASGYARVAAFGVESRSK